MSYKILLIEDNAEMADNISEILQLAKYTVMYAPNGKIGVDLALQNRPDLILCDIMLPELDGYGVLQTLNKNADTADIPFIFLTAKSDIEDFRAGMDLGADDYVTKPFDAIDLLKVIGMRIRKSVLLKSTFTNTTRDINASLNSTREFQHFERLFENRPVRSFKKRKLIFMAGHNPSYLFFVQKGRVKTYKVTNDGKELITGIHRQGDFLGLAALLEDKVYSENAEIVEDARIILIPKVDFIKLIYSNSDVARMFIKLLSNNLEEIEKRLIDIAYHSVRQRVAYALLKLSDQFAQGNQAGMITIARRDISNLVATATESLNRVLSDFKESGLIEVSADGLKIMNKGRLEKIAQ